MMKQGRFNYSLLFTLCCTLLTGCVGGVWTGANLVYDRHNVYKKLSDYRLMVQVNNALYSDKLFKNEQCVLDLAVFNGDVLVAGHVPTEKLFDEARRRLSLVKGYRRLFNEVRMRSLPSNNVEDSWITAKIRSQIFADDSIDPNVFKIITSDRIVYIMGDVRPDQAEAVIKIARYTNGVEGVVKILKYLVYQGPK